MTAAFVGWSTKLLAIKMMFSPERFRGIGPIGWQGMVPRRTAKFATVAAEALLGKLIDPRQLIDELDPKSLLTTLERPLIEASDGIAREFLSRYHPALWDSMPEPARRVVLGRVRARAPEAVGRMLADVRADIDTAFDPRYAIVNNMVRDKPAMTRLVKDVAMPEFRFMVKMGTLFGAAIGVIQMLVWAATHNHLVLPLFGGFVGLFTDWIALWMILAPRERTRYLGLFHWQGLFFKRRERLSRSYARQAAESLLTPAVMLEAVLDGPLFDRLVAMVAREAQAGLAADLGPARSLVELAIGSEHYRDLREAVTVHVQQLIPDVREEIEGYAQRSFDVEAIVAKAMMEMDDEEYEGILRPMFKDDEKLIILLGGVLGFLVGELQVTILTHL